MARWIDGKMEKLKKESPVSVREFSETLGQRDRKGDLAPVNGVVDK